MFAVAKGVARACLAYDLKSLAGPEIERIRVLSDVGPESRRAKICISRAVELKNALGILASGDPYRTADVAGASLPGRLGATKSLMAGLLGLAREAEDLYAGELWSVR